MIFRRPTRNRRRDRPERREVLAVRLRSDRARASRRWLVFLASVVLVGGLGIVVSSQFWDRIRADWIDRNPFFAIRTIEITTDGHWITPDQVRVWAGVQEGENLLLVDLQRIKRDLEIIPQLEGVVIERVPPHLLRIGVSEREPIAQVRSVQLEENETVVPVTYYLDAAGMVMPPPPEASLPAEWIAALRAMPVILGINGRDLRTGQPVASRQVAAALALVREFERSAISRAATLVSVDVSESAVLVARTREGGEVTLRPGDFAAQLRRWWAVHEAGLRNSNQIAALDLSLTNHCPVLWTTTVTPPPPAAKPAKPGRIRKTNA